MTDSNDVRSAGLLAITGAVLALTGNALHPFINATDTEGFLAAISDAGALWVPVHLIVAIAIIVLTVALVAFVRVLDGTPGERLGRYAAGVGVVTAPIFVGQIGGLDGTALKTLADEAAAGDAQAIAVADALVALDTGLLVVSITFFLGVALLLSGLSVVRGGIVAPWAPWLVAVGGAFGVVAGLILWIDPQNAFATNVLFRGGALLGGIGILAVGELLRRKATVAAPAPASAAV